MYKLLNFLLLAGLFQLSQAATNPSAQMNITVNVPASCTMSFNTPNLNLTLVVGFAAVGNSNLIIGCTEGSDVSLTLSSTNNWNLIGNRYGEALSYSLAYTGANPPTPPASIPSSAWSSINSTTPVLTGTATTVNWVLPLTVTTATISPATKADTYHDQVTFLLNY